jgi:hypothetical protein
MAVTDEYIAELKFFNNENSVLGRIVMILLVSGGDFFPHKKPFIIAPATIEINIKIPNFVSFNITVPTETITKIGLAVAV